MTIWFAENTAFPKLRLLLLSNSRERDELMKLMKLQDLHTDQQAKEKNRHTGKLLLTVPCKVWHSPARCRDTNAGRAALGLLRLWAFGLLSELHRRKLGLGLKKCQTEIQKFASVSILSLLSAPSLYSPNHCSHGTRWEVILIAD